MILPGLASVTFRHLPPAEVVRHAAGAGLKAIEWGGDVHVPHGDVARARETRRMTEDAGLVVASCGSYYRAGLSERRGLPFERMLETAIALGTGTVRVWAGDTGSAATSSGVYAGVVNDLQRISAASRSAGVTVAMEFHADTLNDVAAATLRLIERVGQPNLTTLWQPPSGARDDQCVASLRAASTYVQHLHVFHWSPDQRTRHPLRMGEARWRRLLRAAQAWTPCRFALLEFVKADCVSQFADDAATLLRMLKDAPRRHPDALSRRRGGDDPRSDRTTRRPIPPPARIPVPIVTERCPCPGVNVSPQPRGHRAGLKG